MRRVIGMAVMAALLIGARFTSPAFAATEREIPSWEGRAVIRLNGGASFPVGNFGDAFNTGYGFGGSIGYGMSRDVLLSAGIAYHNFEFSRDQDVHWAITPFTMNADYRIPSHGSIAPWIGGGIGLYRVRTEVRVGGPRGLLHTPH